MLVEIHMDNMKAEGFRRDANREMRMSHSLWPQVCNIYTEPKRYFTEHIPRQHFWFQYFLSRGYEWSVGHSLTSFIDLAPPCASGPFLYVLLAEYHREGKTKTHLALTPGKEIQNPLNGQGMASLEWLKQTYLISPLRVFLCWVIQDAAGPG